MNWFSKVRRDFIYYKACSVGHFNRQDLVAQFGISSAQASKDIEEFQLHSGQLLSYDIKQKCYIWEGDPFQLPQPPAWQTLSDLTRSLDL